MHCVVLSKINRVVDRRFRSTWQAKSLSPHKIVSDHYFLPNSPVRTIYGDHPNRAVWWVDEKRNKLPGGIKTPSESFKIVSYNVLGPHHGEKMSYGSALSEASSKWSRRSKQLIDHLVDLKSDVYCLQEVTSQGLKELFVPHLSRHGLKLVGYSPACPPSSSTLGHNFIGTAIFVNSQKFEVVEWKPLLLRDYFVLPRKLNSDALTTFEAHVKRKLNSMILARIRLKSTDQEFVIGNVHLHWDPADSDVKVIQSLAATAAIEDFLEKSASTTTSKPVQHILDGLNPNQTEVDTAIELKNHESSTRMHSENRINDARLILCGDFNMEPTCQVFVRSSQTTASVTRRRRLGSRSVAGSGFMEMKEVRSGGSELLSQGILNADHPHHPNAWRQVPGVPSTSLGISPLTQPFRFKNVYDHVAFKNAAPKFTTKTVDYEGWIDHMWHSLNVEVQMVLGMPVCASDSDEKGEAFDPMPNVIFPSDHLPIGAIVRLL